MGADLTTIGSGDEVPYYLDRTAAVTAAAAVNESSVDIAVLDTGVDTDHPDLDGNLAWGVNTYALDGPLYGIKHVEDYDGHGTGMVGIVAAESDGRGIRGVAPDVDVYVFKIGNDGDDLSLFSTAKAIEIAVKGPDGVRGTEDDADVISMSFSSESRPRVVASVVENVTNEVVLVASAGNDGDGDPETDEVEYPAGLPGVIAVGGTDGEGAPSYHASEGPAVDIATPTVDVRQPYLNGTYVTAPYGTSNAAPQVAGAAALLVAKYGELGTAEARRLLTSNATDIEPPGEDNFTGAGRLNVSRALGVPAPEGRDGDGGNDGDDDNATDPTPNVDILELTAPETAVAGETVFVSATVESVGDYLGRYNLTVAVDGTPRARITGDVKVLGSDTSGAALTLTDPGRANVTVASERNLTIDVVPDPAAIDLDAPNATVVGRPFVVNVSVTNSANDTLDRQVTLTADGELIAKPVLTVPPGETVTEPVRLRLDELGNHTIGIRNRTNARKTTTVRTTPAVTVTNVSAPDLDRPGTLPVTVEFRNDAAIDRTVRVNVSLNDSAVENTTITETVLDGDTDTAEARFEVPENGTYRVTVDRPGVANDTTTTLVRVGATDSEDDGDGGDGENDTDDGGGNTTPTGAVPDTAVTDGPGGVAGGTATLSVAVTNVGNHTAAVASVRITDLPSGVALRHVRTGGTPLNGSDGTFDVGDRVAFGVDGNPPAPGETRTATVVLSVPDSATPGETLSVTVEASVNSTDGPANATTVSVPVLSPDSLARFDANDDSRIDAREVLDAIAAYNARADVGGVPVTAADVLDVVAAYNDGRTV